MNFCLCGCGKEVSKEANLYICGHNSKGKLIEKETRRKISKSKKGKLKSEETKRKMSESRKGKNLAENHKRKISKNHADLSGRKHPLFGKHLTEETRKKMSESQKLTIKKIKEKHLFFSQIEEMRYNSDKLGEKEIQVHCKNHNCINSKEQGGWFTPTRLQFFYRLGALEKPSGFGESNFYCSIECKNECPLFRLRTNPFKHNKNNYTQEEYETFRKFVLQRDNYICQFCGEKAADVHHERPQKLEPFFVLDPDYAWSCCKKCHYEKGHKDECSTGNLASKIC